MNGSLEVRSALADLDSVALSAEQAGMDLVAYIVRRSASTIRAALAPTVVAQEDDGDVDPVGEWIDPTFIVRPS